LLLQGKTAEEDEGREAGLEVEADTPSRENRMSVYSF
jgi:hypothetical protein